MVKITIFKINYLPVYNYRAVYNKAKNTSLMTHLIQMRRTVKTNFSGADLCFVRCMGDFTALFKKLSAYNSYKIIIL